MANIITIIRILCSIAILFCPVFSMAFYSLYITAGVSDMADGWVARQTNTASKFGAKLDTFVSSLPLQRFRKDILSEQKDKKFRLDVTFCHSDLLYWRTGSRKQKSNTKNKRKWIAI